SRQTGRESAQVAAEQQPPTTSLPLCRRDARHRAVGAPPWELAHRATDGADSQSFLFRRVEIGVHWYDGQPGKRTESTQVVIYRKEQGVWEEVQRWRPAHARGRCAEYAEGPVEQAEERVACLQ
ncbi:unnamed protein product, partial [Phaeothamnion confervicola]